MAQQKTKNGIDEVIDTISDILDIGADAADDVIDCLADVLDDFDFGD